jgi:hypothetical protein
MPTQSFSLTPAEEVQLKAALASQGYTLPNGNQGQVVYRGIVLSYNYDGTANLVIGLVKKDGWLPTWGMICDEIQNFINHLGQ